MQLKLNNTNELHMLLHAIYAGGVGGANIVPMMEFFQNVQEVAQISFDSEGGIRLHETVQLEDGNVIPKTDDNGNLIPVTQLHEEPATVEVSDATGEWVKNKLHNAMEMGQWPPGRALTLATLFERFGGHLTELNNSESGA